LGHLKYIKPFLLPILETLSYEVLGVLGHGWFRRKFHLLGVQDDVVRQNGSLAFIVSKRLFSVKALVKQDPKRPDVNFGGYFWRVWPDLEAFWRQIPVGPGPRAGQVHPMVGIVMLVVHNLGEAEIRDLDIPAEAVSAR